MWAWLTVMPMNLKAQGPSFTWDTSKALVLLRERERETLSLSHFIKGTNPTMRVLPSDLI